MPNAANYIKGDENFMKCVSPWTWFKVEVFRRGANLGGTKIEDSVWCKSFFFGSMYIFHFYSVT